MDKKTRLAKKELFWYILSGTIALLGIIFIVFGIIGDHLEVDTEKGNWVIESENAWLSNWSHMGYRWWGLILLMAGALIAVVSLTLFAREGDRDSERAARRAQRLAMENEAPVIEAEENKEA